MIPALIIADIIMGVVFFFRSAQLPPQIPLFYSRPWGEDQLVDLWIIIVLPVLMHLFIFSNAFLNRTLFKDHELIRVTFSYLNWFFIISFTAIFVRIIFLVS